MPPEGVSPEYIQVVQPKATLAAKVEGGRAQLVPPVVGDYCQVPRVVAEAKKKLGVWIVLLDYFERWYLARWE